MVITNVLTLSYSDSIKSIQYKKELVDILVYLRLVQNQSENGKYNLISVWFNKISKIFIYVWFYLSWCITVRSGNCCDLLIIASIVLDLFAS